MRYFFEKSQKKHDHATARVIFAEKSKEKIGTGLENLLPYRDF